MLNLFIFNHINKNETIKALLKYKRTHAEADYCEAARGIIEFAPKRLTNKNILGEFVLRLMLERAPSGYFKAARFFAPRCKGDFQRVYKL